MSNHEKKTNAMRLLEAAGIPFVYYEYSVEDGKLDAVSISAKIGRSQEEVFKTLVTQNQLKQNFVFVIPAGETLDLKKAAKVSGSKSIEMILSRSLLPLTGYIHGGCSPVGMKKLFPTYIDETALLFDTICVSGGRVGTNLGLSPEALAGLINAQFTDLT